MDEMVRRCLSSPNDYVRPPGEPLFDFPCSQTFRDYDLERCGLPVPQEPVERTVEVQVKVPDKQYQTVLARCMALQKQIDAMKPTHHGGVGV